jgi:hypothetical protein
MKVKVETQICMNQLVKQGKLHPRNFCYPFEDEGVVKVILPFVAANHEDDEEVVLRLFQECLEWIRSIYGSAELI